ncbi:Rop family plasmid primer RNA-binding protein, partial [Klebsiella pneumoniae]
NQSLLLLEKLNELDLDAEADLCEKLHDAAEHLFRTLSSRLDDLQDGN